MNLFTQLEAPVARFEPRPYQQEAHDRAMEKFQEMDRLLGIQPTASGKTIVAAFIAKSFLEQNKNVLFLAHTNELCQQAADKMESAIGMTSAFEKAESAATLDDRLVVSSMQSMRERCSKYPSGHFGLVIVDEAHRTLGKSYQRILKHFHQAKVLGLTATPARGDKQSLGKFYEDKAFEAKMPDLVNQGYLAPIRIRSVPLELDLSNFSKKDSDTELDQKFHDQLEPHLDAAANVLASEAPLRKTVVFLPLIETARKFAESCRGIGLLAKHVHGKSEDREKLLRQFDQGRFNVLCNSMLLTEGWDCPSVDCIFILRLVRSWVLYAQMVGRGNRICEGKKDCLLLDPLYIHEDLKLIRPAHLVAEDDEEVKHMTDVIRKARGRGNATMDLFEAQSKAAREREDRLRKELEARRDRKKKSIDAMDYMLTVGDVKDAEYAPEFKWEEKPPTKAQLGLLAKFKIDTDTVMCRGHASKLIDKLTSRRREGLATPRQVALLNEKGFTDAKAYTFKYASSLIDSILPSKRRKS